MENKVILKDLAIQLQKLPLNVCSNEIFSRTATCSQNISFSENAFDADSSSKARKNVSFSGKTSVLYFDKEDATNVLQNSFSELFTNRNETPRPQTDKTFSTASKISHSDTDVIIVVEKLPQLLEEYVKEQNFHGEYSQSEDDSSGCQDGSHRNNSFSNNSLCKSTAKQKFDSGARSPKKFCNKSPSSFNGIECSAQEVKVLIERLPDNLIKMVDHFSTQISPDEEDFSETPSCLETLENEPRTLKQQVTYKKSCDKKKSETSNVTKAKLSDHSVQHSDEKSTKRLRIPVVSASLNHFKSKLRTKIKQINYMENYNNEFKDAPFDSRNSFSETNRNVRRLKLAGKCVDHRLQRARRLSLPIISRSSYVERKLRNIKQKNYDESLDMEFDFQECEKTVFSNGNGFVPLCSSTPLVALKRLNFVEDNSNFILSNGVTPVKEGGDVDLCRLKENYSHKLFSHSSGVVTTPEDTLLDKWCNFDQSTLIEQNQTLKDISVLCPKRLCVHIEKLDSEIPEMGTDLITDCSDHNQFEASKEVGVCKMKSLSVSVYDYLNEKISENGLLDEFSHLDKSTLVKHTSVNTQESFGKQYLPEPENLALLSNRPCVHLEKLDSKVPELDIELIRDCSGYDPSKECKEMCVCREKPLSVTDCHNSLPFPVHLNQSGSFLGKSHRTCMCQKNKNFIASSLRCDNFPASAHMKDVLTNSSAKSNNEFCLNKGQSSGDSATENHSHLPNASKLNHFGSSTSLNLSQNSLSSHTSDSPGGDDLSLLQLENNSISKQNLQSKSLANSDSSKKCQLPTHLNEMSTFLAENVKKNFIANDSRCGVLPVSKDVLTNSSAKSAEEFCHNKGKSSGDRATENHSHVSKINPVRPSTSLNLSQNSLSSLNSDSPGGDDSYLPQLENKSIIKQILQSKSLADSDSSKKCQLLTHLNEMSTCLAESGKKNLIANDPTCAVSPILKDMLTNSSAKSAEEFCLNKDQSSSDSATENHSHLPHVSKINPVRPSTSLNLSQNSLSSLNSDSPGDDDSSLPQLENKSITKQILQSKSLADLDSSKKCQHEMSTCLAENGKKNLIANDPTCAVSPILKDMLTNSSAKSAEEFCLIKDQSSSDSATENRSHLPHVSKINPVRPSTSLNLSQNSLSSLNSDSPGGDDSSLPQLENKSVIKQILQSKSLADLDSSKKCQLPTHLNEMSTCLAENGKKNLIANDPTCAVSPILKDMLTNSSAKSAEEFCLIKDQSSSDSATENHSHLPHVSKINPVRPSTSLNLSQNSLSSLNSDSPGGGDSSLPQLENKSVIKQILQSKSLADLDSSKKCQLPTHLNEMSTCLAENGKKNLIANDSRCVSPILKDVLNSSAKSADEFCLNKEQNSDDSATENHSHVSKINPVRPSTSLNLSQIPLISLTSDSSDDDSSLPQLENNSISKQNLPSTSLNSSQIPFISLASDNSDEVDPPLLQPENNSISKQILQSKSLANSNSSKKGQLPTCLNEMSNFAAENGKKNLVVNDSSCGDGPILKDLPTNSSAKSNNEFCPNKGQSSGHSDTRNHSHLPHVSKINSVGTSACHNLNQVPLISLTSDSSNDGANVSKCDVSPILKDLLSLITPRMRKKTTKRHTKQKHLLTKPRVKSSKTACKKRTSNRTSKSSGKKHSSSCNVSEISSFGPSTDSGQNCPVNSDTETCFSDNGSPLMHLASNSTKEPVLRVNSSNPPENTSEQPREHRLPITECHKVNVNCVNTSTLSGSYCFPVEEIPSFASDNSNEENRPYPSARKKRKRDVNFPMSAAKTVTIDHCYSVSLDFESYSKNLPPEKADHCYHFPLRDNIPAKPPLFERRGRIKLKFNKIRKESSTFNSTTDLQGKKKQNNNTTSNSKARKKRKQPTVSVSSTLQNKDSTSCSVVDLTVEDRDKEVVLEKELAPKKKKLSKKALRKKQMKVYEMMIKYFRKQMKLQSKNQHKKKKDHSIKESENLQLPCAEMNPECNCNITTVNDGKHTEAANVENKCCCSGTGSKAVESTTEATPEPLCVANISQSASDCDGKEKNLEKFNLALLTKNNNLLRFQNRCLASERLLLSKYKMKKKQRKELKKLFKLFKKVCKDS